MWLVSGGGERRCRRGGMVCGWSVGEGRDGVGGERRCRREGMVCGRGETV